MAISVRTHIFMTRCRKLTVTVTSTLGVFYALFLLYLMASQVTNFDSKRPENVRYAALKAQNFSFATLLAAQKPSGVSKPQGEISGITWCLIPEKNLSLFLRSLLCA